MYNNYTSCEQSNPMIPMVTKLCFHIVNKVNDRSVCGKQPAENEKQDKSLNKKWTNTKNLKLVLQQSTTKWGDTPLKFQPPGTGNILGIQNV